MFDLTHQGDIYSSQFKGQSEFMVKLCDIIKECGFDHAVETEMVKFLFLTHNQNSHVREELLKNMKDGDSLNTILVYVKHVDGTQHSEHLSMDQWKSHSPFEDVSMWSFCFHQISCCLQFLWS